MRSVLVLLLALAAPADGGDLLREARAARAAGRFAESADLFRRLLSDQPGRPEAVRELPQVLSWDGRYDRAVAAYDRALARFPGEEALLLGKARTLSWAGRFEESLSIYGRYLSAHPGEAAVRLEEARVRSWSGDYDAAIEVYRAHLEGRPGDRPTRQELAKVLSWAKRFDESVGEFEALLAAEPGDREALLGLARVLSWAGDYEESIRRYRELLARHPEDEEARVGLARTLSWSGDLAGAEAAYDAVLAGRPESAGALLGKAQLAFWRGEARRSERLLARAEAASPGHEDVAALRERLRRSRRPRVDATYDRSLDTEGNDHELYRLTARFGLTPALGLSGLYRHTDAYLGSKQTNACVARDRQFHNRAEVDFAGARLDWSLPGGVGLRVTAGMDRARPSTGESTSRAAGSVVAFGALGGDWRWRGALERRTFDATRVILDCGIAFDAVNGGVHGTWHRWRLAAAAGFTDFSDGNSRLHGDLSAIYPFEFGGQTLDAGYRFRYMAYDRNLANGYFDPQSFFSHLVTGTLRGRLFHPKLNYALRVDLGVQSFELDAHPLTVDGALINREDIDSGSDTVFGWEIRLGWNVTDHARLEAYYGENDYAAQSATGFESQHSGLLLRYRF